MSHLFSVSHTSRFVKVWALQEDDTRIQETRRDGGSRPQDQEQGGPWEGVARVAQWTTGKTGDMWNLRLCSIEHSSSISVGRLCQPIADNAC